ncbi:hypothetical protein BOW53_05920 [Solemya pervernicosa gill symbiont]|uniref:DUF72 domain-containing protein n=2 Tax=Gammaproteobacteria incertae sedis TaxID=118884 RepID=A0A1T2L6Y9_9GAMM|nr:hypothetical protein [Candidatus Reidiella endopervernicosa]OOZ40869.1 hypothetical protein BOW53_05920 [Solemya pervernicosa gill symbiont]QKQ26162.1 hypothetical protein HUE57_07585 [Candidatus Reidiella endopervernicosa]
MAQQIQKGVLSERQQGEGLPKLFFGGCGWDLPALNALYPEDLPQEWRLDFYSSEFSALLLPEQHWRSADAEQWSEWCELFESRVVALLEVGIADVVAIELLAEVGQPAACVDALLLRLSDPVGPAVLHGLAEHSSGVTLYIDGELTSERATEINNRYGVLPVWHAGLEGEWGSNVGRISLSGADVGLPQLAEQVKQFLHQAQGWRSAVLLVDSGAKTLMQLREIAALTELYGV